MTKSIRIQSSGKRELDVVVCVGLDLGDKSSSFYAIDDEGEMVERGKVMMRKTVIEEWAKRYPSGTVVAMEAGTHSPWVSRTIAAAGHDAVVANSSKVPLISKNQKKSDRNDPEILARLARFDRKLLYEIEHRGEEAQKDLQIIRSREIAVGARTKLVSHVRGTVKAYGLRVPKCSTPAFVNKATECLDESLLETLKPVLDVIDNLSTTIHEYDRRIKELVETRYPEAQILMQIRGVGALTALAYVLVIEDPSRFDRSRSVGPYVGLVAVSDQSGEHDPELRITKAGDRLLRRLLVQSAHYIMGPFGVDCDLRRHGEAIASRGGKNAKKRAAVAVARKLAVLMHRLWITGDVYDPLYNTKKRQKELAPMISAQMSTTEVGLSH